MSNVLYQTTVVNATAGVLYCAYLPPHGRHLAVGEEVTFDGDLQDILQIGGGDRQKLAIALKYHLDNEKIEVKSSPSPVLFDATLGVSKTLDVDDGVLRLVDVETVASPAVPIAVGP